MTNKFYEFLCRIDYDFPTPLSRKVDLKEYAVKLSELAFVSASIRGNDIVGCVAMYCNNIDERFAYIPLVAVDKPFRGKHISKALMMNAIVYARENGFKTIGLHTENQVALNLYLSLGFIIKEDGLRKYLELSL